MRDHDPIVLEKFNGLWQRGDPENTPLDHFQDCLNITFEGGAAFKARPGLGKFQSSASPLENVVRIYNYPTASKSTLLVLTYSGGIGNIYHVTDAATISAAILTITGMTDFGYAPYDGRAYITPFVTAVAGGLNSETGMQSEFVYVYKGDGVAARKIAGASGRTGSIAAANGAAGYTDPGTVFFAVVGETDTGYLGPPELFVQFVKTAANSVSFSSIQTFVGSFWAKRHIVATKRVDNPTVPTADPTAYQYFFIPGATITDNITTVLNNLSYYDADLLEDASHLLDNFSSIAAGVGLFVYHNRLCVYTQYGNISVVRVSERGDPEAFNQITGILQVPPDSNPITNIQELRDVLYVFKRNKTFAFVDNEDVPSSWSMSVIDQAIGTPVHGIATISDSGSSNIDFLIVASYKGILLFNGKYVLPELSWKISDYWLDLEKNDYRAMQLLNEPINQIIYCVLPNGRMLIGNYANGLDPKEIRWAPWLFDVTISTVALFGINDIILGGSGTTLTV